MSKGNEFYGWVTVSSRGQIAIPADLRKKMKIKDGDRMLIVIRQDNDGLNLIKSNALGDVFKKFIN